MNQAALAVLLAVLGHGPQEKPVTPPPEPVVQDQELTCLAEAIYYEARGEPKVGQKAVAEVVIARTKLSYRPHTICGVVYESWQFSFTFDGSMKRRKEEIAWLAAQALAAVYLQTPWKPVLPKRTTYFARYDVEAAWIENMDVVAQYGDHVFYRPKPRNS